MKLLPDLMDLPMGLGEHLEELRRRLFLPIGVLVVLFVVGFAIEGKLKLTMLWPLERAVQMLGPKDAKQINLPVDSARLLIAHDISASALMSMRVSMIFAFAITIPFFLYQMWKFAAVGLKDRERRLGFLFIPLGIIFFYAGAAIGFFLGLPWLYYTLLEWNVSDPTIAMMMLDTSEYFDAFVAFTICFGLVMDIPWLVMVLVRVGLVSPEWLAGKRRYIILINLILAAVITPTGDPITLTAAFLPMQLLYEGGLYAAKIMMWMERRRQARGETDA